MEGKKESCREQVRGFALLNNRRGDEVVRPGADRNRGVLLLEDMVENIPHNRESGRGKIKRSSNVRRREEQGLFDRMRDS